MLQKKRTGIPQRYVRVPLPLIIRICKNGTRITREILFVRSALSNKSSCNKRGLQRPRNHRERVARRNDFWFLVIDRWIISGRFRGFFGFR